MDIEHFLNIINNKFATFDNYIDKIITDILFIKVSDKSTQTECICCKMYCPIKRNVNKYTVDEQVHLMKNMNQTVVNQPTSINKKQRVVRFIDNLNEPVIDNNKCDGSEIIINNKDNCINIDFIDIESGDDDSDEDDSGEDECGVDDDRVDDDRVDDDRVDDDRVDDDLGDDDSGEDDRDCRGGERKEEKCRKDECREFGVNTTNIDLHKNECESLINSLESTKNSLMDTLLIDSDSDNSSFGDEYEMLNIDDLANEKKEN